MRNKTMLERTKIIMLHDRGYNLLQISKHMSINRATVRRWVKRDNEVKELLKDKQNEIELLHEQGSTPLQIARMLDVPRPLVTYWTKRIKYCTEALGDRHLIHYLNSPYEQAADCTNDPVVQNNNVISVMHNVAPTPATVQRWLNGLGFQYDEEHDEQSYAESSEASGADRSAETTYPPSIINTNTGSTTSSLLEPENDGAVQIKEEILNDDDTNDESTIELSNLVKTELHIPYYFGVAEQEFVPFINQNAAVYTTRLDDMNIFKQNFDEISTEDIERRIILESKPEHPRIQPMLKIENNRINYHRLVKKIKQFNNKLKKERSRKAATVANAHSVSRINLSDRSLKLYEGCKPLSIVLVDCKNSLTEADYTSKLNDAISRKNKDGNIIREGPDNLLSFDKSKVLCRIMDFSSIKDDLYIVIKNLYLSSSDIYYIKSSQIPPVTSFNVDHIISDEELCQYVKSSAIFEFINCCWYKSELNIQNMCTGNNSNIDLSCWIVRKPHNCPTKCICCCKNIGNQECIPNLAIHPNKAEELEVLVQGTHKSTLKNQNRLIKKLLGDPIMSVDLNKGESQSYASNAVSCTKNTNTRQTPLDSVDQNTNISVDNSKICHVAEVRTCGYDIDALNLDKNDESRATKPLEFITHSSGYKFLEGHPPQVQNNIMNNSINNNINSSNIDGEQRKSKEIPKLPDLPDSHPRETSSGGNVTDLKINPNPMNSMNLPNVNTILQNPATNDPAVSTLITSILEKYKNIRLSVNERGLVTANLDTSLGKMSSDELEILATILSHTQKEINAIFKPKQLVNQSTVPPPATLAVPILLQPPVFMTLPPLAPLSSRSRNTQVERKPEITVTDIDFTGKNLYQAFTYLTDLKLRQSTRSLQKLLQVKVPEPRIGSVFSLSSNYVQPTTSGVKRKMVSETETPTRSKVVSPSLQEDHFGHDILRSPLQLNEIKNEDLPNDYAEETRLTDNYILPLIPISAPETMDDTVEATDEDNVVREMATSTISHALANVMHSAPTVRMDEAECILGV